MAHPLFLDIQSVLKDVDALVSTVEEETGKFVFSTTQEETSKERLRTMGTAAFEGLAEKPRDGYADLEVNADHMEVRLCLYPPTGSGTPLPFDALLLQLEKAGVVHGVLEPVLRRLVTEAAVDRKSFADVVVAKGTPPVDAYPERWDIEPSLTQRKAAVDPAQLSVDFKKDSPFVLVKKGEVLAVRVPEQAGSQGWNVFGEPLEFTKLCPKILKPGKNVEARVTGFNAGCDGCFKTDEKQFWVDEVLVLQSGVSYSTGHIEFAGDVHLVGDVAAGFHIHAEGALYSTRVIDATEILCGGDITTPFGIVGHPGSVVKTEGRIRAKFLENLFVLAKGRLEVQSSVLNCILQTLDRLVMGEKGVLVGGRVMAQNGIDAFQVGTERGAKAELICGMDFTIIEKIDWARDQSVSLVKQLKTLEAYKQKHPKEAPAVAAACEKIRRQVMKLGELSRDLVDKIDKNDDVEIVVRGTIHQGTYLEICHISHVVPRAVQHVRFVLDKNRGEIRGIPL